jgi:hypothetical protein
VVRGCPSTTHHFYHFLPQFEMWRSIVLDSFWWCVGKRRVKRCAPVVQTITALHKLHEAIFARKQPRLENQRERQRGSRVVGFLYFFIQTEYMFTSRWASFRCCYFFGGRVILVQHACCWNSASDPSDTLQVMLGEGPSYDCFISHNWGKDFGSCIAASYGSLWLWVMMCNNG